MASFRMMLGEAPDHGTTPVVPDPHRLLDAQGVEKVQHVGDDLFLGVVLMAPVDTGTPIAPHVGGDGAEAQSGHDGELVAP